MRGDTGRCEEMTCLLAEADDRTRSVLLRHARAEAYEIEQGLHAAAVDDRILHRLVARGEVGEGGGALLLHPDPHAKVDLAPRKDWLDLDGTRDADARLGPAARRDGLRVERGQVGSVEHGDELTHAALALDDGAPRLAAADRVLVVLVVA